MDSLEEELKSAFLEEAASNLEASEQCFLDLEREPGSRATIEKLFRIIHNIKGSANAVGFSELGAFSHELESLLLLVKNGDITLDPPLLDLLLRANDHLTKFVKTLKADRSARVDSGDLLQEIQRRAESSDAAPKETVSAEEIAALERSLMAEQPALAPTAAAAPPVPAAANVPVNAQYAVIEPFLGGPGEAESRASSATPPALDESIRVSLARLDRLMNFVGEMVILQSVMREQASTQASELLRKTVLQMGKVTKEVQDISMSLRMVPLSQTFQKMQRIVRDTSRSLDKEAEIKIKGEETELDKTVLEQLGDPLVHLVRNAVDHGLESGAEREAAGKPRLGHVELSATQRLGQVIIEVKDDGRGLDPERLIAHAIKKGVLKPGQTVSPEQAYQLIFAPGFSTKEQVSDVSGRGVGMDVVKTNIERLRGDVTIQTELGKGTSFKIRLPLTLAVIEGMVVRLNKERFIVPLTHVSESIDSSEMRLQDNATMGETLLLRGENIPLLRLTSMLGRPRASNESESTALVVRITGKPFGVLVDSIVGQQQVVIKPLGREVSRIKGFAGSAILGDGLPALILELPELARKQKSFSRSVAA